MGVHADLGFESTTTLTQAEFADWLLSRPRWDINRYELMHGRVVMTPPAGYPHGTIEIRLGTVLETFVHSRGFGISFGPSQGFELPSGDTVAPDFAFIAAARWDAAPPPNAGGFVRLVPDLVVEILSRSTAARDRDDKRAVYERNGVREYWIVDPAGELLLVFCRRAERFDAGRTFPKGSAFESEVLEGLRFDVGTVLP